MAVDNLLAPAPLTITRQIVESTGQRLAQAPGTTSTAPSAITDSAQPPLHLPVRTIGRSSFDIDASGWHGHLRTHAPLNCDS